MPNKCNSCLVGVDIDHNFKSPCSYSCGKTAPTIGKAPQGSRQTCVYTPSTQGKKIRAAREMMKNVQGSSAGAGSGEFHVYKASRRREYGRLELLEEATQKETEEADFERKRREAEEFTNAKTVKNRAKRQKKKEKVK